MKLLGKTKDTPIFIATNNMNHESEIGFHKMKRTKKGLKYTLHCVLRAHPIENITLTKNMQISCHLNTLLTFPFSNFIFGKHK